MNHRHLARARFARTSAEGGGGGNQSGQQTGSQTGDGQSGQQTGNPPPNSSTGPVEATDETGAALGFPKDTPVDQMTDAQKAAYWRNQTKTMQKRVPSNLTELQEAKRKWDEYQQSQQTPADQEIERVRKETEERVRREAAEDSVTALMRVTLSSRGKDAAEVDELVEPVNAAKFLTQDGKVDTARVTAFVDKIAPAGQAGGGNGYGQGRGFGQSPASKRELGEAEARKRFGGQKEDPNRGALGGLRR